MGETSRLHKQISEMEKQLEEKDVELSELHVKYNDVNLSFSDLTSEFKDLKNYVTEHKKSQLDSEKIIMSLEQKYHEKDCTVQALSSQLKSSHQHVEAVQSELGESISEISRKGTIISDLENEIEGIMKAKESTENELS